MNDIQTVIGHLEQIRDAGGELVAYELTPQVHFGEPPHSYWSVDFRAEMVTPESWEPRL